MEEGFRINDEHLRDISEKWDRKLETMEKTINACQRNISELRDMCEQQWLQRQVKVTGHNSFYMHWKLILMQGKLPQVKKECLVKTKNKISLTVIIAKT